MKEIFITLKRKQEYEHMPMLEKRDGSIASSKGENRRVIQENFSSLFSHPPPPSKAKMKAIQEVERCKNLVVSNYLAKQMEAKVEELGD